jgi:hypothetical protein
MPKIRVVGFSIYSTSLRPLRSLPRKASLSQEADEESCELCGFSCPEFPATTLAALAEGNKSVPARSDV